MAVHCSDWRRSSTPDSAGGCLRCWVAWRARTVVPVSRTVAAGVELASSGGTGQGYTSDFPASV